MKKRIIAYCAASVLALGAFSTFAHAADPADEGGSSEVSHIVSGSYLISIPSDINLDGGTEPNFTGTASISASDVRLNAGEKLTVSFKSNNGFLKKIANDTISKISYTIAIDDADGVDALSLVDSYSEVFTIEAGETEHSAVSLNFATTSFDDVKLAGKHKDVLTFKVKISDGTEYMQDIASLKESFIETPEQRLADERDGKEYYVSKIGDDIWMTQNLNYVPSGATWAADGVMAGSGDIFTDGSASESGGDNVHFSQGAYYTWGAANKKGKDETGNACPDGWALPTKEQFVALKDAYDKESILTPKFYGVRAGRIQNDAVSSIGEYGYYWSATEEDDRYAYALQIQADRMGNYSRLKSYGYSVRCVAK